MQLTLKLILCRHTQTDYNAADILTGQKDIPLNQNGINQARKLADKLAQLPIQAVYCSDLIRAVKTAEILAERHGLKVRPDARLREVSLGKLDGMKRDEARAQYPDPQFHTKNQAFNFRPLGGESYWDVIYRQVDCLNELAGRHSVHFQKPVIIVGHGTALRILLHHLGQDNSLAQGDFRLLHFPA